MVRKARKENGKLEINQILKNGKKLDGKCGVHH